MGLRESRERERERIKNEHKDIKGGRGGIRQTGGARKVEEERKGGIYQQAEKRVGDGRMKGEKSSSKATGGGGCKIETCKVER